MFPKITHHKRRSFKQLKNKRGDRHLSLKNYQKQFFIDLVRSHQVRPIENNRVGSRIRSY